MCHEAEFKEGNFATLSKPCTPVSLSILAHRVCCHSRTCSHTIPSKPCHPKPCSVFAALMSLGFFALLGICFNCSESTIYCCISPRKGQNWHTGAAVAFSNCTSYSISALKKMKKALNKVLWIDRCLIKERSKLRNIWIYFVDHEASELYLIQERINRVSKVAT